MDILVAAVVSAAVAGVIAVLAVRSRGPLTAANGTHASATEAAGTHASAGATAVAAADDDEPEPGGARSSTRRDELVRLEEYLRSKEQTLDARLDDLDERERRLQGNTSALEDTRQEQLRALERVAGLSPGQAKQLALDELEQELRHDSARLVRQVEEETRHEADRRVRSILSTVMQRVTAGHVIETTVTSVALPSDELKGRVIGREGRNIRTLETLTGVDVIIDDTPGAILLSSFDGVRREIARATLEKLLADGRIHPARIEEAYHQARSEIGQMIVAAGEQAVLESDLGTVHPELTKQVGRLKFRTSYGQNVLAHSIECARLGALLAAELGANPRVAARACLLHDIGKASSHENQDPHALVAGQLARRYKEDEAVAHAAESHHNEVEPQTVEAVIVQIADAISGARPGARGASLERYVSRLHELEEIAARHPGVDKVFAVHAGREIRVIVHPDEIDDDAATLLSRTIATEVEQEVAFPGQIKVTVIRESRSTSYAR